MMENFQNYKKFIMTGSIKAAGNIMSLFGFGDTFTFSYNNGWGPCYSLFGGATSLTDVTELLLGATTLSHGCYRQMFINCSGITTPPIMSATTTADACCQQMFQNCYALTSAPELPATTLAQYCYQQMFQNCSSLVVAPYLPAPLGAGDYPYQCYMQMFSGCTSLTSVSVAFTAWSSNPNDTYAWLDKVASQGEFHCPAALGTNATITRGADKCPNNWTVVNDIN